LCSTIKANYAKIKQMPSKSAIQFQCDPLLPRITCRTRAAMLGQEVHSVGDHAAGFFQSCAAVAIGGACTFNRISGDSRFAQRGYNDAGSSPHLNFTWRWAIGRRFVPKGTPQRLQPECPSQPFTVTRAEQTVPSRFPNVRASKLLSNEFMRGQLEALRVNPFSLMPRLPRRPRPRSPGHAKHRSPSIAK